MFDLRIHDAVDDAATAAAREAAEVLRSALADGGSARLVAATGTSQLAMLRQLVAEPGIDWKAVELFHLDEYIGVADVHPASFARYIRDRLVEPTGIVTAHLIDGTAEPTAECSRLDELLRGRRVDLLLCGIGENGHLAFNDPPADMTTDAAYLVVELDDACRRQQVGEGWFETVAEVPTHAISMSMRQILRADRIVGVVTGLRKSAAMTRCFGGEVSVEEPASFLRTHDGATLFADTAAATGLTRL